MIDWVIETSLAVTFLMLLVLAVRRPVAHFFGAGWAYALWALPALRLILPPLHIFGDALPSVLPARQPIATSAAVTAAPPVEAVAAFDWEPLLLAAWVAGAAAMILWQASSYLAFTRRLGIGSRVHASFAQDVGVIESPQVDGPLAIGLLDKWIVVPADFTTRYSEREQRLALEHERVHHQREDIFWNMVAIGVLALNWYNPIAYLAFRAFRTDQELSCDAAVAARASSDERHDYALALLKSASRPGLIAACPLNHAGQLKHRLRMIKAHRRSHFRAAGGSGVVAALMLTGVSATESPGVAAPEPASAAREAALILPARPAVSARPATEAADAATAPAPPAAAHGTRPRMSARPAAAATAAAVPAVPVPQRLAAIAAAPTAPPQPEAAEMPAQQSVAVQVVPRRAVEFPAPARAPARVHIRIDTPARYTLVTGPVLSGGQMLRIEPDGRQSASIPPEVAAKLQRALAQAVHLSTNTRFHVIRLKPTQEN